MDMRKLNGRYPRTQAIKNAIGKSKLGNQYAKKKKPMTTIDKETELEFKILGKKREIKELEWKIKGHGEAITRRKKELESKKRLLEKLRTKKLELVLKDEI